jgi:hypothetical protein
MQPQHLFGPADTALVEALNKPFAWPQSGLEPLPWFPFTVAVSPRTAVAAVRIATRCERAYWVLRRIFGVVPRFRLLVLDRADWDTYAEVPTYGIVHVTAGGHLVVGSEPADAWHDVSGYLAKHLPAAALRKLVGVHGRDSVNAGPDLTAVADALIAHELAHLFATQAGVIFPKRWLAEAFANYALIAVLGETDPAGLHRLGTLAEAAHLLDHALPTLETFEEPGDGMPVAISVLAQLALTRSAFAAYADAQTAPLAQWFAFHDAAVAASPAADAGDDYRRQLGSAIHAAIAAIPDQFPATHAAVRAAA